MWSPSRTTPKSPTGCPRRHESPDRAFSAATRHAQTADCVNLAVGAQRLRCITRALYQAPTAFPRMPVNGGRASRAHAACGELAASDRAQGPTVARIFLRTNLKINVRPTRCSDATREKVVKFSPRRSASARVQGPFVVCTIIRASLYKTHASLHIAAAGRLASCNAQDRYIAFGRAT